MRHLTIGLSLLICSTLACVSDAPIRSSAALYRTYPPRAQDTIVSRPKARSVKRARAPRALHPEWLPRGLRISQRWTHIVIHHSATKTGGANRFDRYHRRNNGWDELGYHFVIGNGTDTPDGYVEVGPRWLKQKHGAHCKTPDNYFNEHGIGICLVGDFTKTTPTNAQLASLYRVVRFLCDACSIPGSRVTAHDKINRKTQCPGKYFGLAALRRALVTRISASSLP